MMSSRNRASRLNQLDLAVAFVLAASAGACTSDDGGPAGQSACQPGQTSQCSCGASFGTLACTPSGTWGMCQCAAPVLADAGSSAPDATTPGQMQPATMDAGPALPTGGDDPLPCEISALFKAHCADCHGAMRLNGAPMSLVTWSDLQKPSPIMKTRTTRDVVLDRIKSTQSPMPPAPYPRLSAAEIATYEQWLGKGAAKGNAAACQAQPNNPTGDAGMTGDGSTTGMNLPKPNDCEQTFSLTAHGTTGENDKTKFKMSSQPSLEGNQYHCFYFKPPYPAGAGMLWYDSILDNRAHLHHWILYATDNATHASGTSAPCNAAEPGAYFVAGWAPGATNASVPPDALLQLPSGPNAGLILEVHYYNDSGMEQLDGSGLTFCTAKPGARPHTAGIHTLGSEGICIQPAARAQEVVGSCSPRTDRGDIHITGVWPHMHKMARRQKVVIKRASGATEVIHDEPFDFNSQVFYPKGDIVVKPGDSVETHCYYDNDTSAPIHFGERTQDEMCYAFVAAWPAGALTPSLGPSSQGVNRCADDLSIRDSCNGFLDAPVTVEHPP
jgi:mono/diheme cytochrome c family protein